MCWAIRCNESGEEPTASEDHNITVQENIRSPKSDISILQLQPLSRLFLKVHFLAKLKCPHVGYVSAFAKDFLAPCLELLQGFQNVVLIQTSLGFLSGLLLSA